MIKIIIRKKIIIKKIKKENNIYKLFINKYNYKYIYYIKENSNYNYFFIFFDLFVILYRTNNAKKFDKNKFNINI